MTAYFVKRLLMVVPTLLLVTLAVFLVMQLVPGDPVLMMMRDVNNPELVQQLREELGLDKPAIVQYFNWLGRIAQLDFGHSIVTGEPVLDAMFDRFAVTAPKTPAAITQARKKIFTAPADATRPQTSPAARNPL